jgi:hypothetical protein
MPVNRVVFFIAVAAVAVSLRVTGSFPSRFLPQLVSTATSKAESDASTPSMYVIKRSPTLEDLKKAHITSSLPPGTLDSYRTDGCIFVGADFLAGRVQKGCIKGTLGILMPSSAYLMVTAGKLQIFQLVSPEGSWRITAAPDRTPAQPTQNATKLEGPNSAALREQIAHSLVSFLRLLNSGSSSDLSKLKLSGTSSHIVVTWTDGATSNQYFFNRANLLCDKQIRTNPEGVAILKYSGYKNVDGAMLPYRIEMEGSPGKLISTEVVEAWILRASWPPHFFTRERVVGGF